MIDPGAYRTARREGGAFRLGGADLIRKGLTLIGAWHYPLQVYPLIMKVIRASPLIELADLVVLAEDA